ncbi:MAG: oligosaccharide flippase family protein [Clostridia bacterium]|nr:oligosaccharide flippase family protein [Clostridia bacterium]
MKKNNTISGVIALLISQVLVKMFGLVYKLYLANKTGFGDMGNAIYNSGYQIYALLLTISTIGVPSAVAKLVAEQNNSRNRLAILKSSLVAFSIIGIVGSIVLIKSSNFIATKMLDIPEAKKSIIALSPAIFNVCIISVYRGYFNGINKINITAKSQTIEQIFKTIFTIVFVEIVCIFSFSNVVYMAAFANFATTAATMCGVIYLCMKNRGEKDSSCVSIKKICKILCIAFPISISAILASLNKNIDSITVIRFLKLYMSEEKARIQYGILSGKIDVISSVPVSFIISISATIIPMVASYNRNNNKREICDIVRKYIKYTTLFILPCCVCMFIFSKEILELLFGSSDGAIYFKISSLAIIFIAMEQIINSVLQGMGRVFVPAIALGVGVIAKLILNLQLLKLSPEQYWYGGVAGCCVATLVCHIIAFFIAFSVLKVELKLKFKNFKFLLKAIIASCIMAVSWYYTCFILNGIIIKKLAIILAGIIAVFIYMVSIYLLKLFSDNELSFVYECTKHDKIEKNKKTIKNKEKRRILYKNGE